LHPVAKPGREWGDPEDHRSVHRCHICEVSIRGLVETTTHLLAVPGAWSFPGGSCPEWVDIDSSSTLVGGGGMAMDGAIESEVSCRLALAAWRGPWA
jgi:hypothetical protein